MFGSNSIVASVRLPARVRVRLEIHLSTPPIGYVGIELRRGEIRVTQHLLDRAEIGAPLEEVRGEGVPQEVRVDAFRLEPGFRRQAAQDQERAGAGQPAALGVEEELRAVAGIEEWAAAREIAAQSLDGLAPDRHHAFFRALAKATHEPGVQIDALLLESDRFADAEPTAVQQLAERAVTQCPRRQSRLP